MKMIFRTNDNEILAVYAEYNSYYRLNCIPLTEINGLIIRYDHTSISLDYYHRYTKPLKDLSILEKYKSYLENCYNESVEIRKRLSKGV